MPAISDADLAWCHQCRPLVGLATREVASDDTARLHALRALVKPQLAAELDGDTPRKRILAPLIQDIRKAQDQGNELAEIELWTRVRAELARPVDNPDPAADGGKWKPVYKELQGLVGRIRSLLTILARHELDTEADEMRLRTVEQADLAAQRGEEISRDSSYDDANKASLLRTFIGTIADLPDQLQGALDTARRQFDARIAKESAARQEQVLQSGQAAELTALIQRAVAALMEIRRLPGAEAEINFIRGRIHDANEALKAQDWSRGFEHVRAIPDKIRAAKANNARAIENASRRFADIFAEKDELAALIDDDNAESAKEQLRIALDVAVRPLLAASADAATAGIARDMLGQIRTSIASVNQRTREGQAQADARIREFEQALSANPDLPVPVLAPFRRRLEALGAIREQGLFPELATEADKWSADWEAMLTERRDALAHWNLDGKNRIAAGRSVCTGLADHDYANELNPNPEALLTRLTALHDSDVGGAVAVDIAFRQLQMIETDVARLDALCKAKPGIAATARGYESEFEKFQSAFDASLEANAPSPILVRRWMEQTDRSLDPVGDLREEFRQVLAAWQTSKGSARSVPELERQAEALLVKAAALAKKADSTKSDSWSHLAMDSFCQEVIDEVLRRVPPVEELVESLRSYGIPAYGQLKAQLAAFRGKVRSLREGSRGEELRDELAGIQAEIMAAIDATSNEYAAVHAECTKLAEQCRARGTTLRERMEQYAQSIATKDPANLEYSKQLLEELKGIDSLLSENDIEVLESAKVELVNLKARLETAAQTMHESKSPPANVPIMSNVDKQIADCKKLLGNRDFKKYAANTHATVTEKLESIEEERYARPAEVSLAELAKLRTTAQLGQRNANAAKASYLEFTELVEAAKKDIKSQEALKDFEDYRKTLLARVEGCRADGANEGRLQAAKDDLRAIVADLKRAMATPGLLQVDAEAAAAAKEQRLADIADVERLFSGVVKRQWLPDARNKVVKAKGDMTPFNDLKEFADSAHSSFKKSKDHEMGRSQLRVIERRYKWLAANPGGASHHARLKLDDVEKRWQAGVEQLRTDLQGIVAQVRAGDPGAAPAVETTAAAVSNLFLDSAFRSVVRQMMDETADAATLRNGRERGLAIVRRYRSTIKSDRRLLELVRNPFTNPFAALTKMNQALFAMERNLLVSAS